jgi:hypothetical protein
MATKGKKKMAKDWADDDEVTITFRTMKQMISEAQEAERAKIVTDLKSVFFEHLSHHSESAPSNKAWDAGFRHAIHAVTEGKTYDA